MVLTNSRGRLNERPMVERSGSLELATTVARDPDDVLHLYRAAGERGRSERESWEKRLAAFSGDRAALDKVSELVDEAVQKGAEILIGGKREDPFYLPTVLRKTERDMKVRQEEIFGPVVTLESYEDFDDAIELANETTYGLQAGVFTNDINRIFQAHRDIEVGGVVRVVVRDGRVIPEQIVLIKGNRITAIVDASRVRIAMPARVIDGTGKFVMPGLIDAHSHAMSDAVNEGSLSVTSMTRIQDVLNPTSA